MTALTFRQHHPTGRSRIAAVILLLVVGGATTPVVAGRELTYRTHFDPVDELGNRDDFGRQTKSGDSHSFLRQVAQEPPSGNVYLDRKMTRALEAKSNSAKGASKKSSQSSKKSCKISGSKKSKNSGKDECNGEAVVAVTPEPDASLLCNGDCVLPTGARMSVALNLLQAFPDIVSANGAARDLLSSNQWAFRALRGLQQDVTLSASFHGQAAISDGTEDATPLPDHFTYLIDASGSAFDDVNHPCGDRKVVDCEVDAFKILNDMVAKVDNVASVAVVSFAGEAIPHIFGSTNTFVVSPRDPAVVAAINQTSLDGEGIGDTNFENGLLKAFEVTAKAMEDPRVSTSQVVFVTDGEDVAGNGITTEIINMFVGNGIQVKAFALGNNSLCTAEMDDLAEATGTGRCTHIFDPAKLAEDLKNNYFTPRSLQNATMTLDDDATLPTVCSPNMTSHPAGLLPTECPLELSSVSELNFSVTSIVHKLCVEAFSNYPSDPSAACCLNFTLKTLLSGDLVV
jgi:hypothetical protein